MKRIPSLGLLWTAFCLLTAGISFTPLSVLGPATAWAKEKVTISSISFPPYGAWYIVKKRNLAKDIEIEVRILEDIRQKNGELTAGKTELMTNTLDSMVWSRAAGVPVKVIAIPAMSYGLDEMVVSGEIRSVQDFVGKAYGSDYGFLNHMWMLLTLKRAGIPVDRLKHVVALPADSPTLFLTGATDIDVNYLPFSLHSERRPDSHVLKNSFTDKTWERGLISEAIAVNERYLKEKPEIVKELLRAWFEAVDWWKEHPAEGDQIVADGLDWPVSDVALTMRGAVVLNLDQNLGAFGIGSGKPLCRSIPAEAPQPSPEPSGWGKALFDGAPDCVAGYLADTWRLFNAVYREAGVATREVDPAEALDPGILQALSDESYPAKYNSNRWIGRTVP